MFGIRHTRDLLGIRTISSCRLCKRNIRGSRDEIDIGAMTFVLGLTLLLPVQANASPVRHADDIWVPPSLPTTPLLPVVYGYPIEPIWVEDYVHAGLTTNLLGGISDVIGKPAPIRIGGNIADQTYLHPDQYYPSVSFPTASSAIMFNISAAWYSAWAKANYFPNGTEFVYTLNLHDNFNDWANAVLEAQLAYSAPGQRLKLLELGNEIDHSSANTGGRWAGTLPNTSTNGASFPHRLSPKNGISARRVLLLFRLLSLPIHRVFLTNKARSTTLTLSISLELDL